MSILTSISYSLAHFNSFLPRDQLQTIRTKGVDAGYKFLDFNREYKEELLKWKKVRTHLFLNLSHCIDYQKLRE